MPATTDFYKKQFEEKESIQNLKRIYQIKIFEILKAIAKSKDNSFGSKKWLNYHRDTTTDSEGKISNEFFYAATNWLRKKNYLKGKYNLSEKGYNALFILNVFSSEVKRENMVLYVSLYNNYKVICSFNAKKFKGKDFDVYEKFEALTDPMIVDAIRQIVFDLVFKDLKNFEVTIKMEGNEKSNITHLLHLMRLVQGKIVVNAPLSVSVEQSYTKVWKPLAKKAINILEGQHNENLEDFSNYIRPKMKELLKKGDVRKWIERKLDDEPNFYMPHALWVFLGFRKRCKFEPIEAKPISYDSIVSLSDFEKLVVELKYILEMEISEKETPSEESLPHLHSFLVTTRCYEHKEFYEAWNILRKSYGKENFDISRIFDASLEWFIINKKPSVDLDRVFSELEGKKKEIDQIVEDIRSGEYDFKS